MFSIEKRKTESFMVGILAHSFLKSILEDGRGHPTLSFMGRLNQIVHIHTTSTTPSLSNLNTRIDLNILCFITQESTVPKRCGVGHNGCNLGCVSHMRNMNGMVHD